MIKTKMREYFERNGEKYYLDEPYGKSALVLEISEGTLNIKRESE